MNGYQQLVVWQKSIDLTEEIYKIVKYLPSSELYALSNQMRRAVVSIPSNIAEGHSRRSTKEYINFLVIARGSVSELETQLIICRRLNFLAEEQIVLPMRLCAEIGRMINALIEKLSEKTRNQK